MDYIPIGNDATSTLTVTEIVAVYGREFNFDPSRYLSIRTERYSHKVRV